MTGRGLRWQGDGAPDAGAAPTFEYIYEPAPEQIFKDLLPRHVQVQVYRALLESNAAFFAAQAAASAAPTAGTDISQQQEGRAVINEVQTRGAAGTMDQFIEIANASRTESVDLSGWALVDRSSARSSLAGTLAAGAVTQVSAGPALRLGNEGGALVLVDGAGRTVDHVAYTADRVRPGRTIAFGR